MLDDRDRKILALLQEDASTPVQTIAEAASLSPSACSRRITTLQEKGFITGTVAKLDRQRINLPTTIFVLVRTSRHSDVWIEKFQAAAKAIPEIVEVHRLTGNFDYILKIVLPNVEHYDVIYKQLIGRIELFEMSAYISMETVKSTTGLPLGHI